MKINKIIAVLLLGLAAAGSISGQNKPNDKITNAEKNVNQADTTLKKSANALTSSAKTLTDLKNSFGTMFSRKSTFGDTTAILISGIDYDDQNLSGLKENIKKVKGVKSLTTGYKSGAATILVSFKGSATQLWDEVPGNEKQFFKLIEAGDHSIILQYKNVQAPNAAKQ